MRSETSITELQTSREGVVGSIANPFFGGGGGGGGRGSTLSPHICICREWLLWCILLVHTYVSADNGGCEVLLQNREPSRPKGWPSSPEFCKVLQRGCFPFKNIQSVCEV